MASPSAGSMMHEAQDMVCRDFPSVVVGKILQPRTSRSLRPSLLGRRATQQCNGSIWASESCDAKRTGPRASSYSRGARPVLRTPRAVLHGKFPGAPTPQAGVRARFGHRALQISVLSVENVAGCCRKFRPMTQLCVSVALLAFSSLAQASCGSRRDDAARQKTDAPKRPTGHPRTNGVRLQGGQPGLAKRLQ